MVGSPRAYWRTAPFAEPMTEFTRLSAIYYAVFMDGQEVQAGHVFISYRHEDSASVDRLESRLVDAGIQVWRDKKDLWPGDHWRTGIRRAITDGTLVFLACFSSASLARPRSLQNEELSLAVEEMRLRPPDEPWLIPIRFDNCDIPDIDIGPGRTLRSVQRSDLFGDNADAQAARLVAAIKRILGQAPDPPPHRRRWPVVLTACGALIIAAGAVVAVRELTSSSPPRQSSSSAPKGSFVVPSLGATVGARKQLHASGTANIQPGHKLELFLQFGDQANYYAAGDPRTSIPLVKGRWHGEIYIGAAGTITLWLVDLPPHSVVLINKEVNYQNNGFPNITKLGKILASVQCTAK